MFILYFFESFSLSGNEQNIYEDIELTFSKVSFKEPKCQVFRAWKSLVKSNSSFSFCRSKCVRVSCESDWWNQSGELPPRKLICFWISSSKKLRTLKHLKAQEGPYLSSIDAIGRWVSLSRSLCSGFVIFFSDRLSSSSRFRLPRLGFISGLAMEASSSQPPDSSDQTASKFLADLPSRGFLSSTVVSSNPVILLTHCRLFCFVVLKTILDSGFWNFGVEKVIGFHMLLQFWFELDNSDAAESYLTHSIVVSNRLIWV